MQAAVELDVVHTWNAENNIDAVFAGEQINYRFTDTKLVVSHALVILCADFFGEFANSGACVTQYFRIDG